MKTPTPKNVQLYRQTIDDYEAAIMAYYEYIPDEYNAEEDDVEGAELLFAAAQAALINMRTAWENLSGIKDNNLKDSDEARKLLNQYIEDPNDSIDDFVLKLKGEPVSLETLTRELNNDDNEVTYKLLTDIFYRMGDYRDKRKPKLNDLHGYEQAFEEMGKEMAVRRVLVNALWLIKEIGNR